MAACRKPAAKRRLPGPAGSVAVADGSALADEHSAGLTQSQQLERKKEIVQYFCMPPWRNLCRDLNVPTIDVTQSAEGHFAPDDVIAAICADDLYFQRFLSLHAENLLGFSDRTAGADDSGGATAVFSTLRDVARGCYTATSAALPPAASSPPGTAATTAAPAAPPSASPAAPLSAAATAGGKVRRLIVVVDGMQSAAATAGSAENSLLLKLIDPTGSMVAFASFSEGGGASVPSAVSSQLQLLHVGSALLLEQVSVYIHKELSGRWSRFLCVTSANVTVVRN